MDAQLIRNDKTPTRIIGELMFAGRRYFTLESANPIPPGSYDLMLTTSGRAQRRFLWTPDPNWRLPEIINVPGYFDIRICAGNTVHDIAGSIFIGLTKHEDAIFQSREALRSFISKLTAPVTITIS